MRKEVIIAISLGFIVGLFIAYGIYTANRAVKQTKVSKPSPSAEVAASSPQPETQLSLIINEPEENIVLDEETATLSGQTEPKTAVAVLTEKGEDLVLSDEQGFFSSTISLVSGLNEIKIIATAKTGEKIEKLINIFYSTAEIE